MGSKTINTYVSNDIKSRNLEKSFQAGRTAGIQVGGMNGHGVCEKMWKFLLLLDWAVSG